MPWLMTVFMLSAASLRVSAINRPVYKIVLNQKGYAQFLQYDIDTPPLREFTFCTWFRIYDLFGDQSIFTYVANSNNRVMRLWLDSGGRQMMVSIDGKVASSSRVDIMKDVWRHVCLSYQSDHGAWALYLDARLITCEVAQSLQGFVLPGGGSVIVGYGTNDNGGQNGLEGEIFGANMLLMSTIEKNYTIKSDPFYGQRPFKKNKVKSHTENVQYVILKDLQTGEVNNKFETFRLPDVNKTKNFIKFRTPHSFVEHNVGVHLAPKKVPIDKTIQKEIYEFPATTTDLTTNLWNLNQYDFSEKFVRSQKSISPVTKDLVMLSEYETPPPIPTQTFFHSTFKDDAPVTYKKQNKLKSQTTEAQKPLNSNKFKNEISLYETPPPIDNSNKVYGQWSSSKFASSVLNHLKNLQLYSKEQKKVPATIPLNKFSDSFPYASEFKLAKLRPPPQFQRKNLVERRFDRSPQINVHILEDDIRNQILKTHAQTQLKHAQITHRGLAKQSSNQHRFYRNVDSQEVEKKSDSTESIVKLENSDLHHNKINKLSTHSGNHRNNLISILPFLKPLQYFTDESLQINDSTDTNSNGMYTRSLSNGNKWHNVKSYSNDYTPRKINIDPENRESGIEEKIAEANKKHPSLRLKYKHKHRKVELQDEEPILKGRELALRVSNNSDYSTDSISILKYNHGFLPGHKTKSTTVKMTEKLNTLLASSTKYNRHNNFNKNVKIGNALNEHHIIGVEEEEKQRSFVGGDDKIPDINRFRSDIDMEHLSDVPSSLRPRICKNVELYDRVLYVQPDESIDMSHILSPVKAKNIGIEFIIQNYKKCSLEESLLQHNVMLFIDWSKTPVRLFGGAYPVETTDLCGFF